ncbi:LADA_0G13586g1_1 [Lachancea dasiensis]|uniref:DNA polymerase eta n=1 Tax=Lachancea dasiensis TaxID=1072105 RepID=A0A1G4JVN8_9SACH|nr:LADA_0G13586g1_1 [Lachancea dasiensis]
MSSYKWRDLLDLNSKDKAYLSPLSCIAHIDINAFFAQVEQIRCHYSVDEPVVCVQWNSIIAVSYAARKYGITRMDSVFDAFKKCDHLIPVHTAVFRKGEDFWQYRDDCGSWHTEEDKKLTPEKFKVSLDPYRRESRKVINIFNEWCDMVEKGSVDEVFLDLGRNVFECLFFDDKVEGFGAMRDLFKNGGYDLDDFLPQVPGKVSIYFEGNDYNPSSEHAYQDWDDILFCLGSIICNKIRSQISKVLGYTTSCGIARTKTMAKLASNFKKPDAQTIIRNNNICAFLDNESLELTSFWSMGGIIGKGLTQLLELPNEKPLKYIRDSWPVSSDELRAYLKEKTQQITDDKDLFYRPADDQLQQMSEKVFQLARGEFRTPLSPKPMVRSMMSNKNLRGNSCQHYQDCLAWLEVFSGELIGRIKELEEEYEKIVIPKTLTISVRTTKFQRHSRGGSLVVSGHVRAKDLMERGTRLIKQLDCKHGNSEGFYPLTNINMMISNFEIVETGKTIVDMFGQRTQVIRRSGDDFIKAGDQGLLVPIEETKVRLRCDPCNMNFEGPSEFKEHEDFHFAMKLSESLNGATENSTNLSYGERRLLFSNSKRVSGKSSQKIGKSAKKSDIYKYFNK